MKKRIVSLVFGVFMAIFSVCSLAGCSLVSSDNTKKNKKTVVKIDDVELSRSDIVNSFYTYYQNNSSYFSYYDNETIEESFYTWAIMKELINQKSEDALYNPETNPNGFIVFNEENDDNVWKNTYDYIYDQVSSYEKNIYKSAGYAEANYPVWISANEEDAAETTFEAYEKISPEGVCLDKSEYVAKATDEEVLKRVKSTENNLKTYVFEYVVEEDEDGNQERDLIKNIIAEENAYIQEIEKDKFIKNARSQAYVDYLAGLTSSAKSQGNFADEMELFEDEIIRIYNAYYESEVTTLLQKYYLDEYLLTGENTPLTEKAIAEAFLNKFYSDYQTYTFEDAYITTMTSQDGASLVLYHYNGQNYFFTVQHILVQNDEHITEDIKNIPGYDSSGKFDYDASNPDSVANQFFEQRKDLTDNYFMASSVNEDNVKSIIDMTDYAYHYYYDSSRANQGDNWGYIRIVKEGEGDDAKYFEDADADGVADLIDADNDGDVDDKIEVEKSKVLYLATDEQIELCYQENLKNWIKLAEEYQNADETGKSTMREDEDNADFIYVFDTVDVILANDKTDAEKTIEIRQKIASYLFVELEWIFSSDSLGNKLSNKMGYVMSNYPDEHGSWVPEFADGARELIHILKNISGTTVQAGFDFILTGGVDSLNLEFLTHKIISTYGYHIIKVENVFECGSSMVDVDSIETELGVSEIDLDVQSHVDAVIDVLKSTFVCSASNQTLYDYYFDELYTGFVGSSWLGDTSDQATSGTYFLKLEYEWLYELYQAGKIEYVEKIGIDELLESIS